MYKIVLLYKSKLLRCIQIKLGFLNRFILLNIGIILFKINIFINIQHFLLYILHFLYKIISSLDLSHIT